MTSKGVDSTRGRWTSQLFRHRRLVVYMVALALYLIGVWLHLPNSGGHIYSDLVSVFLGRECQHGCHLGIPYVQTFVEYPIITSMFMYFMALLGSLFSGSLIDNYYYFTSFFLFFPTILTIHELFKIAEIRKSSETKVLWYFVLTPTFVYMVLLNWYVIGVYFAVAGLRRYLQGSYVSSGVLYGLSAASNLITAVPALGLLVASRSAKERVTLVSYGVGVFAVINIPFIIVNPHLWYAAFNWTYNWYIENSWIQLLSTSTVTPLRHYIPPVVFGIFIAGMLWLRFRRGLTDPVIFAFLSMFGYVFSTYIYTPQMNLTLLPFFVILPVAGYVEFLVFDVANASIIILGLSQALLPLGITYKNINILMRFSILWWVEAIRSIWVGKLAVINGIPSLRSALWGRRSVTTKKGDGDSRAKELRPAGPARGHRRVLIGRQDLVRRRTLESCE